jgi:hypothetical protein
VGILFFDKQAYSAPATMKLTLIDFDLAGQTSATVHVSSSIETNGENFVLHSGTAGVFTGFVATATGAAIADGKIQVAHGAPITATYQDVSPVGIRIGTARADLLPPVITNVSVTNRFGQIIVSWQTDEPSTSIIRLGTNADLSLNVTSLALTTQHQISVQQLVIGATYFFLIVSVDEAGNSSTNDNGGNLFRIVVKPAATVLLVNAYVHGSGDESVPIPVTSYTSALDQVGVSYEVWDVASLGSPTATDLRPFRAIIWRINDSIYDGTSISTAEQTAIQSYLNSGGAFFMASMEILSRLGDVPFRSNVLHVQRFTLNPDPFSQCDGCDEDHGVPSIEGFDSDPVTSGIDVVLDYSPYPSIEFIDLGPDFSDTFGSGTNAASILMEPDSGRNVGIRYPRTGQDSSNRVVFFSFPLDTVPMNGSDPNNRANLLRNAIAFLVTDVGGLGRVALDSPLYTIPSLVTIEVVDSDLAGLGQTAVSVFSDTAPNQQTITLSETPQRGVFRGFVALVSKTNAFQPGELRVQHGDLISVEYFDASANGITRATASIDTTIPVIANLSASPDYLEATISWSTSKPADALVQFGESPLMERTGYSSDLETDHFVSVAGLQPDKDYYFQVTSRDPAGNTTTENNHGSLYTFHTLRPFDVPWINSLENSRTNWSVVDTEGSETTWKLGMPGNDLTNQCHSGTNAWGSNLDGNEYFIGATSLISPAIRIPSSVQVTLRFWHNYDFTQSDDSETALLSISTNYGNAWNNLAVFSDSSAGWEEVEIDLTQYAGKVVRLGFYYDLLWLDEVNHPGWLLDDISITVTNAVPQFVFKSLVMTNGQARLTFGVPPGGSYVIEGSTNLTQWIALQTNIAATGDIIFTDVQAVNFRTRFYRLKK